MPYSPLRFALLSLAVVVSLMGCNLPSASSDPAPDPVFASEDESGSTAPRIPGGTCGGPSDCASDQVCLNAVCVGARTSVKAELLAAGAAQQAEAGDAAGAAATYQAVIEAYEAADVTPPGAVLCRAAQSILAVSQQAESRERAARMADRCLRQTLPGDPLRDRVIAALGRMRYDGLNLGAFDLPEPPAAFFTETPARPDPNRVTVTLQVTPLESSSFAPIITALQGDAAKAAAQDCFLQDWEVRHEQQAAASFQVRFTSRLRDMGSYDAYPAELELVQQSLAQEGFEPCLARVLPAVVELPTSLGRAVSYETTMTVSATLAAAE